MKSIKISLLVLAFLFVRAEDCPPAPAGIKDIKTIKYYKDSNNSIIDPEKYAESRAAARPVEAFVENVAKFTDNYLRTGEGSDCAVNWLETWAKDRAFLDEINLSGIDPQASYTREWALGSLAISWNKIRKDAPDESIKVIDAWMNEVGHECMEYKWKYLKKQMDGHLYWGGVSYLAVAAATGDKKLFGEAKDVYQIGIKQIEKDGSLPIIMKRGQNALHYHADAAGALLAMAEMSRKFGEDWYSYKDSKIEKLVTLVEASLKDPSWFEKETGIPQSAVVNDLAWIEFYKVHRYLITGMRHDYCGKSFCGDVDLIGRIGI